MISFHMRTAENLGKQYFEIYMKWYIEFWETKLNPNEFWETKLNPNDCIIITISLHHGKFS